jgi:TolA-binding protein
MSRGIIILTFILGFGITYCGNAYSVDDRAFLEGNYDKVVSDTTRLINARSSDSCELYYLRGLASLKLNKYEDARRDFNAILSRYPRSSRRFDAFMGIGDSYFL